MVLSRRQHAPNKLCALNSDVRLITRFYGTAIYISKNVLKWCSPHPPLPDVQQHFINRDVIRRKLAFWGPNVFCGLENSWTRTENLFYSWKLSPLLTHCRCNSYQTRWACYCHLYELCILASLAWEASTILWKSVITRQNCEGMGTIVQQCNKPIGKCAFHCS